MKLACRTVMVGALALSSVLGVALAQNTSGQEENASATSDAVLQALDDQRSLFENAVSCVGAANAYQFTFEGLMV